MTEDYEITVFDGFSTRKYIRHGEYQEFACRIDQLPPGYIASVQPIKERDNYANHSTEGWNS